MNGMRRSRRKSRLSWYKQERLIEHFVAGTTAHTCRMLELSDGFVHWAPARSGVQTVKIKPAVSRYE